MLRQRQTSRLVMSWTIPSLGGHLLHRAAAASCASRGVKALTFERYYKFNQREPVGRSRKSPASVGRSVGSQSAIANDRCRTVGQSSQTPSRWQKGKGCCCGGGRSTEEPTTDGSPMSPEVRIQSRPSPRATMTMHPTSGRQTSIERNGRGGAMRCGAGGLGVVDRAGRPPA
jgi:hypothetical protein